MDDSATAIAIVGIILGFLTMGIVACVWLWAWRSRGSAAHAEAYQKLAQDVGDSQRRAAFELGQIAEDLADVRLHMVEMERMLKEVG
jgi:hypothetical protein